PRGGFVLCREEDGPALDKSVFPGMQGGPLMHSITAKAVCFKEAATPAFKEYAAQIIKNAQVLAETLRNEGLRLVSDGTDNHLCLLDLTNLGLTGLAAENALGEAGITVNKNTIPNEQKSPFVTSGLRIGTPAVTSRGMKEEEMRKIGTWVAAILKDINNSALKAKIRGEVSELASGYTLHPEV
ncbi:MAG: serine hydroxymethyltransferase, partial [Euryarchaeota archaeon]|nr:serine hydroxymethyltransferase [Euryarchaeota archaeon]